MDRVLAGVALAAGGKILLVLSRKDATGRSGRWSIPKGRYEEPSDGNLFEAAARELKEETGGDLAGLDEDDCFATGVLSYARKGRAVVLH